MKDTKLIFIEGIPGSGKSTTAQFISHTFNRCHYSHKWWYEEEKGHPVYVYDDHESMRQVVEDLSNGNYRQVINKALQRWEEFSMFVQSSDEIIIVDSCLFGYLTWSLFPNHVPKQEIIEYVLEVERIVRRCNPYLIYYYQNDIGAALKKICTRRSGDTESHFIQSATQSAYGKSKGLKGFDGMVSYWQDYRMLTDDAFERLGFPKISVNNAEGKWSLYYRQILNFLGIDEMDEETVSHQYLQRFVGKYFAESDGRQVCSLLFDDGKLIVDGLPQVWTRTSLIPRSSNAFDVESLPFQVEFEEDKTGKIIRMYLTGPTLLDGSINLIFTREILSMNL